MTGPNNTGTIDITNLVGMMKETFVNMAKAYILAQVATVPGIGAGAMIFIKDIGSPILSWVFGQIANWEIMAAFFVNTAIKKASQAQDYVDAKSYKDNLPGDVSDADYAKAEEVEIQKFRDFVLLDS